MFYWWRFCILKKARNICTLMLEFTFPGKDVKDLKWDVKAERKVIKKGLVKYIKILLWVVGRVLINKNGWNRWHFWLRIGTVLTSNYVTQTSIKNTDHIFEELSKFSFFLALLCISTESKTKLKKILYLNHRFVMRNTSLQTSKLHFVSYQHLY